MNKCRKGHLKTPINGKWPRTCLECRRISKSKLFDFDSVLKHLNNGASLGDIPALFNKKTYLIYAWTSALPVEKKAVLDKFKHNSEYISKNYVNQYTVPKRTEFKHKDHYKPKSKPEDNSIPILPIGINPVIPKPKQVA